MSIKRITKYVAILSLTTLVIYLVSRIFVYPAPGGYVFPSLSPLTLLVIFSLFLVSSISYFLLKK